MKTIELQIFLVDNDFETSKITKIA